MNLNQLQYFRAVYEKHGLSAAAKALPMTHQGLSQALSGLEAELKVSLFDSSKGFVKNPTKYADALYEFSCKVDKLRESLALEFKSIDALLKNELRLVAATGVFGFMGSVFFSLFTKQFPDINLARTELPDYLCDEELKKGNFGLAITAYPFDDEFETIPLYLTDRVVWINIADPLASCEALVIGDLEGYSVATMGEYYKNYSELKRLLAERGVKLKNIELASEMVWLIHFARAPKRAAFTVPHIADSVCYDSEVASIPIQGIPWGFGISWRKGYQPNKLEDDFIDFCTVYVRSNPLPFSLLDYSVQTVDKIGGRFLL
jgi:DNA-binding transcriptional LysR family regulator